MAAGGVLTSWGWAPACNTRRAKNHLLLVRNILAICHGKCLDVLDFAEAIVIRLIHGLDAGGRHNHIPFRNDAGEVGQLKLADLAPLVGEEQGLVIAQFAEVAGP